MTVRLIPEHVVPGKRLGRHIEWDERSRQYAATATPTEQWRSQLWRRHVPIFDQGEIGDCTAEAITGAVSTRPFTRHIRSQRTCRSVYHAETLIDGFGQPYPPNDRGSSGLAACKVAKARGWIARYDHALTIDAALSALQDGPVITGVSWFDSFDEPASDGTCTITPGAQVRGGHEVCVVGIDVTAQTVRFTNSWSSSWGDGGYGVWSWSTWEQLFTDGGDVTIPIKA